MESQNLQHQAELHPGQTLMNFVACPVGSANKKVFQQISYRQKRLLQKN